MSDVLNDVPPDDVFLIVNGKGFYGWETINVVRSVEAVSASFTISVSDKWVDLSEPWPIFVGDVCTLRFGKETVMSGYVDGVDCSIDGSSHSLRVTGRDRTQDIVDCSAVGKSEYRNMKLEAIAVDLCKPFGIGVRLECSTGAPIPKFALQPGETVLDALARAAKGKRVLLTSSAQGLLTITKAGIDKVPYTLKEGVNLLSCSMASVGKDRYSKYVVQGQPTGFDNESNVIKGTATDKAVERYRPLIILAEDSATQSYVNARAVWEAKTRAGKAVTAEAKVQGWRRPDKLLWRPNSLVPIVSPSCRLNGELVISEIEYNRSSDEGTTTTLRLKRRDAYTDEVELPAENDPANQKVFK